MKYSAIILSGGLSSRFGGKKSLTKLLGKPMISYIVDSVTALVDEILIITDTKSNRRELSMIFDSSIRILLDEYDFKSPVVGAFTGFKYAKGKHSLLLACDTPLISADVLSFLLKCSGDYDAVIPTWNNRYIEPLQAVYDTEKAYEATLEAITQNKFKMSEIIIRLKNVLHISTNLLSKLDPKLNTFRNVNTLDDLILIEKIIKSIQY